MRRSTLQRKVPLKAKAKLNAKKLPSLSEFDAIGVSQRLGDALFPPRKRSKAKSSRPKTAPLRSSAQGEACTLNIASVCNYDSATVVLCHLPFLAGASMGKKAPDFCACYGCSACHDALDGRGVVMPITEKLFYASRALVRTLARMSEKGLIFIKGVTE